jgi:hypothetical protein
MISSISSTRLFAQPADATQRQAPAPTAPPAQDQPALKPAESKLANAKAGDKNTGSLSEADLKIIAALKQRDAEVRAHEAAHLAAAGGIATGGATFDYQQGPDGVRYAIGGEVKIDTSSVPGDPAATLRKADTIRRAALAPAEPSGQDQQVAASASALAAQAQAELLQKNRDSQNGNQEQKGTLVDLRV